MGRAVHIAKSGVGGASWNRSVWWFPNVSVYQNLPGCWLPSESVVPRDCDSAAIWAGVQTRVGLRFVVTLDSNAQPRWSTTLLVPQFAEGETEAQGGDGLYGLVSELDANLGPGHPGFRLSALPMTHAAFVIIKGAQRYLPPPHTPGEATPRSSSSAELRNVQERGGVWGFWS